MEMNYVALNLKNGSISLIYGCTLREEAMEFIGENQKLIEFTDSELEMLEENELLIKLEKITLEKLKKELNNVRHDN